MGADLDSTWLYPDPHLHRSVAASMSLICCCLLAALCCAAARPFTAVSRRRRASSCLRTCSRHTQAYVCLCLFVRMGVCVKLEQAGGEGLEGRPVIGWWREAALLQAVATWRRSAVKCEL